MVVPKRLFNFYINSSIHVALSVYALTYITLLEFDLPYDASALYFVFYATITGYNFVKYFGLAKFHHRRLAGWLKAIQIFSLFSFVLMCYYALQLSAELWVVVMIFAGITFFYAIPFLPKRIFVDKQQNLRSIGGLKVYIIALVWTGVTVVLPLINNGKNFDVDAFLLCVQRFLYIVLLMLPFEIRDLKFDSIKLSTIPQQIGLKRTKLMGIVLSILILLMEFLKTDVTSQSTFAVFLVLTITTILVLKATVKQGSYYSSFWVEGLPIFWLIIVLSTNY